MDDSDSVARANAELKRRMAQTPASEPDPAISQALVPDRVLSRQNAILRGGPLVNRKATMKAQREKLDGGKYLSVDNWRAVHTAYANVGDPRQISIITGLNVKDVEYLLENGLPRLGMPGIKRHAVSLEETQRIIGRYRRDVESLTPDPEVNAAVEDRATREILAAQGAMDIAMETSGLLHAWIASIRDAVETGGLERPTVVSSALLEKAIKATETNTRALQRAVELSRLTAGEPTNVMALQIAVAIANCTPEEIAEASRTRQLPASIRKSGIGSKTSDVAPVPDGEDGNADPQATKALEEWEALRGTVTPHDEGSGEGNEGSKGSKGSKGSMD